jgi:hypothetical protein
MKNKCFFYFTVLTSIGILAGCSVEGVRSANMSPSAQSIQALSPSPLLQQHITIGNVHVSPMAQKSSIVTITDIDVTSALRNALETSGYAAPESQPNVLLLHAQLEMLDIPLGFSMTTTSTINYTLTDNATQQVMWSKRLSTPYTVNFTDSFNGEERLRQSIEKSIQTNIMTMIGEVTAAVSSSASTSTPTPTSQPSPPPTIH